MKSVLRWATAIILVVSPVHRLHAGGQSGSSNPARPTSGTIPGPSGGGTVPGGDHPVRGVLNPDYSATQRFRSQMFDDPVGAWTLVLAALSVLVAVLGVLFTAGAIAAAWLIYRQGRDYRKDLDATLERYTKVVDKANAEHTDKITQIRATMEQSLGSAIKAGDAFARVVDEARTVAFNAARSEATNTLTQAREVAETAARKVAVQSAPDLTRLEDRLTQLSAQMQKAIADATVATQQASKAEKAGTSMSADTYLEQEDNVGVATTIFARLNEMELRGANGPILVTTLTFGGSGAELSAHYNGRILTYRSAQVIVPATAASQLRSFVADAAAELKRMASVEDGRGVEGPQTSDDSATKSKPPRTPKN